MAGIVSTGLCNEGILVQCTKYITSTGEQIDPQILIDTAEL